MLETVLEIFNLLLKTFWQAFIFINQFIATEIFRVTKIVIEIVLNS